MAETRSTIAARISGLLALTSCWMIPACAAGAPRVAEHVLVYREAGRFGGWPANHGAWSWGDEILVGFSAAWFKRRPDDRHQHDPDRPEEPRLARSLDGGRTWRIEAPRSLLPPDQGGSQPMDLTEPMDFTPPGFAMTIRFSNIHRGASILFFTLDRGKTWKGPWRFPLFGQLGIAARTDYIVNDKHDALVFLTASKSNGREGRPLCVRTKDGGKSWQFLSWIGPEPEGFAIMPSTVRLSATTLLTTVRRKEGPTAEARDWIDAHRSEDNGASWTYLSRPAPFTGGFSGNPPSLVLLRDGRLALTYGFRGQPYGIRARLSGDNGKSWGGEIVLRDGGAAWDLGYTRSLQRPDGKIVTVYYFADSKDTERVIRATIWDPGPGQGER